MIVQASPREFIIAALNSYANFNLHYWHYADPEKMVAYWIGYREKGENAIEAMDEGEERQERAARLVEADRVVLNVRAFVSGKRPPNLLNPEAWPRRRR